MTKIYSISFEGHAGRGGCSCSLIYIIQALEVVPAGPEYVGYGSNELLPMRRRHLYYNMDGICGAVGEVN